MRQTHGTSEARAASSSRLVLARTDAEARKPQPSIRVLLAGQQPLTGFGLRRALEEHGFEVCAQEGDAESAAAGAVRDRPDICILDLHLTGGGVAATKAIAAELTGTPILILARGDEPELFDAICAGASGYVPASVDPERLPEIVERALAGDVALPRALVARMIEQATREAARHSRLDLGGGRHLTGREREVLDLLRQGLTTAQIAGRLFISEVTVRTHLCTIRKKLSARDRKAAAAALDEC
jgi:two-component system, NarL family, nitrate/nitrite response regulator NarL